MKFPGLGNGSCVAYGGLSSHHVPRAFLAGVRGKEPVLQAANVHPEPPPRRPDQGENWGSPFLFPQTITPFFCFTPRTGCLVHLAGAERLLVSTLATGRCNPPWDHLKQSRDAFLPSAVPARPSGLRSSCLLRTDMSRTRYLILMT